MIQGLSSVNQDAIAMSEIDEMDGMSAQDKERALKVVEILKRNVHQNPVARERWKKLAANPLFKGKGRIQDNSHYVWLEVLEPHYPAHLLKAAFVEWRQSNSKENFIEWLHNEYVVREQWSLDPERNYAVKKLLASRVTYLTEAERKLKSITIERGLLHNYAGSLFNTRLMRTNHSKQGAAVFVLSQDDWSKPGTLYASSHGAGLNGKSSDTHFFHASFMAGGPVLAAGEIGAVDGKVMWITPKSGHYQPTIRQTIYFLLWLDIQGVELKGTAVQLTWRDPTCYKATSILRYTLRVLEARAGGRAKMVNHFHRFGMKGLYDLINTSSFEYVIEHLHIFSFRHKVKRKLIT